jgi:NAD(P)-dependent dehydrogenase (short-subunit alcohol dehydrogenase family)
MRLAGTRMLVVGGSAGIGRETGLAASRAGATVAFAARRKDRLDEAVEAAGGGHAVVIDVADAASVAHGVDEAVAALGGLDVVVMASGVASIDPLVDETEESWRRVLETNVIGAASVVKTAMPRLDDAGLFVFTSSTNTYRRLWGLSAYGASKAALDRLVDGWRDEHPHVRMLRVSIGPTIGTEFGDSFDRDTLAAAMPRWIVGGQQTAKLMSVHDVGDVLAELIGLLRAFPDVDIPALQLEPPGGLLTLPPTDDVLTQLFPAAPPDS